MEIDVNLVKFACKNSWNQIKWTYLWRVLAFWNHCGSVHSAWISVAQPRFSKTVCFYGIYYCKSGKMMESKLIYQRMNIRYRTRAIISRGLYFFLPNFHFSCGLYYRQFYKRERLQIESGLWWRAYGTYIT